MDIQDTDKLLRLRSDSTSRGLRADSAQYLEESQKKRLAVFTKYDEYLRELLLNPPTKYCKAKKRDLYNRIRFSASHLFQTEEAQYQFIGKYARGIFRDVHSIYGDGKDPYALSIVVIIAEQYGAFDY